MFKSKNYSLEIISQHPTYRNRPLKKYGMDGVDTVGAWEDEPFEIKFKNNSGNRVQVKISIDGTDILSGDAVTTDVDSQMWLVNGYGILQLKAWPESKNGGAAFVFTSAENSVALHARGDISNRGIIAVAVFEEGYVEPVRLNYSRKCLDLTSKTICCDKDSRCIDEISDHYSSDSLNLGEVQERTSSDFKSLASVGAGSYVSQNITYTKGLIKPELATILKIKYVWWNELKAKLESIDYTDSDQTGFPGDAQKKLINLKGTPRIDTPKPKYGVFKRVSNEMISRF